MPMEAPQQSRLLMEPVMASWQNTKYFDIIIPSPTTAGTHYLTCDLIRESNSQSMGTWTSDNIQVIDEDYTVMNIFSKTEFFLCISNEPMQPIPSKSKSPLILKISILAQRTVSMDHTVLSIGIMTMMKTENNSSHIHVKTYWTVS